MRKQGAIELSVSTIVVLVLAMSMLIMGIVLVRNIFSSATKSVDQIDKRVEEEINKLFSDSEKRVVINLAKGEVEVTKGESFGVAFGIRNTDQGSQPSTFTYSITAIDPAPDCRLSAVEASKYITIGDSGTATLLPGDKPDYKRFVISPPETAPLCQILYQIDVDRSGGLPYETEEFILKIVGN